MAYILKNNIRPKGSLLTNLKVGQTEVKFVVRGDNKLFYDTQKEIIYDKPVITFSYPNTIVSAAGGTISPNNKSFSQAWRRKGFSGVDYEQTKISSNATISFSISGTGASINSTTGVVTWAKRGNTPESEREATVTMTVTVNGKTNSASVKVKQAANTATLTGVRIAAYQPDNSWLPTSSWGSIPAGGHYIGVYGYYIYTWSSGLTSESGVGNLSSGLTYTTSMAEVWKNGGLHIVSRGTSYSASTRSGTVYWTYNGLKSNTLNFTQNANTISITSVTSSPGSLTGANFTAAGETKSITATGASASALLTYSSGSTVTTYYNSTDYGTWQFHGYTGSSNQSYAKVNSTAYNSMSITYTNNTSTSTRSATITRKEAGFTFTLSSTYGGASKRSTGTQCTCSVTQSAGSVQYIITPSVTATGALAAAGGSKTSVITYTTKWNGITTATGTALSGYTITEATDTRGIVSASGTSGIVTITSSNNKSTSSGTFSYTISKSGYTSATISGSVTAGAKGYGSWTGGNITFSSTGALSAGADSRTITIKPWSRTWGWNATSGEGTEYYTGTVTVSENGSYTSINTTSYTGSSSNKTITLTKSTCGTTEVSATTVTITAKGATTTTGSLSQTANAKTSITYGTPSVSLSYGSKNAAAGTVSPSYSYSQSRTQNYTSGATSTLSALTSGGSLSFSETTAHGNASVNTSTGVVTWNANTGSARSVGITLTVTMNSKSGSKAATSTQSADAISGYEYANPTVTFNNYGSKNAAAGSIGISATPTYVQVRTNIYISGARTTTNLTTGGTITYSGSATGATVNTSNGTVTWTANTNESSTRSVTVIAKVTMNGKSGTDTATSTQAKDGISSYTYANPVVTFSVSDIPASGGERANGTVSYSQVRTNNYISGKTSTTTTLTSGGSISYSTKVSVGSLGTTLKDRTKVGTLTATVTMNGKSGSKTVDVYQQANTRWVSSTSGGVTTYGNITAGTITNATVPASGGTKTATAGKGSQTWSKTAIVTSYKYTSGATSSATTTAASSGTNTINPSVASISATGSHLGTTETAQTTLKSQTVTWTGSGGKSASGTMYVYQQANVESRTVWGDINIKSFSYANKDSSSGNVSPSISVEHKGTRTYTSGSTKTVYSASWTIKYSYSKVSGSATVDASTGVITWTTNTGSDRTTSIKVTVTSFSKTATKTVTATQKAPTSQQIQFMWHNQSQDWVYFKLYQNGTLLYHYEMEQGQMNQSLTINPSQSLSVGLTIAPYDGGNKYYQMFFQNSGYPVCQCQMFIPGDELTFVVPASYFNNGDTLIVTTC